jgi:outer membrane receptor protein involved in Fe transport
VKAQAAGAAADWTWNDGARTLLVAASGRFVDATLEETAFGSTGEPQPPQLTAPEQTTMSAAVQGGLRGRRVSLGAGARAEVWRSKLDEGNRRVFVSPRFWGVFEPGHGLTVRLALQSGARAPTINELYRPFRVGSVITRANAQLGPESARGVEGGVSWHRRNVTLRALAFWSRVEDAITNVTLSVSGPTIVRERQNAARIRAAGVELEAEARISPQLVVTAASSFTDSVFAAGPLDGLRLPQVPRAHHAIGARGSVGPLRLSGEWRFIGLQFDDDRNLFELDRSSTIDARAGWLATEKIELFAAVENVLDAEQDVGRTPLRTLGLPRTTRAGLRLTF